MARPALLTTFMGDLLLKTYQKDIEQGFVNAYESMVYDMYEDAFLLFDRAMDQYYAYETTTYIRHGEKRPGTKKGTNLREANQTQIVGGLSLKPTTSTNGIWRKPYNTQKHGLRTPNRDCHVQIIWDSAWMLPYKRATQSYVLTNVLNGIRGVPTDSITYSPTADGQSYTETRNHQSWSAVDVELPNSGMKLSGTPMQMLDAFLAKAPSASANRFRFHRKREIQNIIAKIIGGGTWRKLIAQ